MSTEDQALGATSTDRQEVVGRIFGGNVLRDVRIGRHPTFDRLVFEYQDQVPTTSAEYVAEVTEDGTGDPVPLRGRAFLQVSMQGATSFDGNGTTFPGIPEPRDFAQLRQIADTGDFEAVLTFGVGVAASTPFGVTHLPAPPRVVIDCTHTPPGTGDQLLRRGDRSAAVATWQWRLRLALKRELAVDEAFGPATEAATRDFQQARNLGVDGIVGRRSRAAMAQALGI